MEKATATWNNGTGDRCDSEELKMLSLGSVLELVLRAVWSQTGTPGPTRLLKSAEFSGGKGAEREESLQPSSALRVFKRGVDVTLQDVV